jgi:PAS domain-containing protein
MESFAEARDMVLAGELVEKDLMIKHGSEWRMTKLHLRPWYNESAQIQGVIVSFEGELAGFSLDSDGWITDCTHAAAAHLGYDKDDVNGKALVSFVDEDSLLVMGDAIMELFDEWHDDEGTALEDIPDEVCQVTMVRESGRMVQTTWDLTRVAGADPTKKFAMAVMHKEQWLGVRGSNRKKEQPASPREEVKLTKAQQMARKAEESQREEVHLSALELSEAETLPVRFHFVVMQKDNNLDGECSFEDFKKYLRLVFLENRPWGLHQVNCFMKRAMESKFQEIGGAGPFSFAQWEAWWNLSPNRTNWDGGPSMKHTSPPGRQLATDMKFE